MRMPQSAHLVRIFRGYNTGKPRIMFKLFYFVALLAVAWANSPFVAPVAYSAYTAPVAAAYSSPYVSAYSTYAGYSPYTAAYSVPSYYSSYYYR